MQSFCRIASFALRRLFWNGLLGAVAGAASYFLLLCLLDPWEELLAAVLIGAVVGITDRSGKRLLIGSIACATGWLVGSLLFNFWIELGIGAWIVAGALLSASFALYRRWWVIFPALVLGSLAGLLAELARFLTVFLASLRGLDMQLLLLLAAGLLLNVVAGLFAPPLGTVRHAS